jgi:hypothetical protein
MSHTIRQWAGTGLLNFAIDRSLERQEMERRLAAAARPGSTELASAMATLAAARWFESMMIWVGWRLHPGRALSPEAGQISR